jgi:propionate CoA-transferase
MSPRFVGVAEAVATIEDGATVATDGFTMMGVAEAVLEGISDSFKESNRPRDLTLVHASGQSDGIGGIEHFAEAGLVRRVVGSHWGLAPRMSAFLYAEGAEAVCLPQGQLSTLYRAIAAGRPGHLSRVGLGTFVDPRMSGGKINGRSRSDSPDYVTLTEIDGEECLFYRAFPVDVAIIRATSVDDDGNCTQDEEAVSVDSLSLAQAAHNSGGTVIVQAKQRVKAGEIPPRTVAIPGCLIDFVVMSRDPARDHRQTHSALFDPQYISPGVGTFPVQAGGSDLRYAIGRRAVQFLEPGEIVNVGTGIPGDTVGPALAEAGLATKVTLSVESGVYQGIPAGGVDFGIATAPSAIINHSAQFDFYDGGGLDATFMGVGQVDRSGNVNVSRLGSRVIGCGGFIDIVQSTHRVYFCFTFAGAHAKFVDSVDHLTFSAEQARLHKQEVYYITERAVFKLGEDGLVLIEVAKGLDVQLDVLAHIPFAVNVAEQLGESEAGKVG